MVAVDAEQPEQLEQLSLSLALWVIQQEGDLTSIDLVVNALARLANQTVDSFELEQLFYIMSDILNAVLPAEQTAAGEPPARQPWQLLLLNRAIVATRSHRPQLMEPAFDAIVEWLPDQATRFFAEGMEQMTMLDYPDDVREIVRRYYLAHAVPRRLH